MTSQGRKLDGRSWLIAIPALFVCETTEADSADEAVECYRDSGQFAEKFHEIGGDLDVYDGYFAALVCREDGKGKVTRYELRLRWERDG
jgi:hypothetical protein